MDNELKGKRFPVLNHGHVILVDCMGDDQAIVDAARTAYQQGTKPTSDSRTLLRYLMRHRHSSPFECCTLKFHVKLPIFVERQWARHRTAGWNEVSARYSELPEEYYIPEVADIREQSKINKQGRGESVDTEIAQEFREDCNSSALECFSYYRKHLGEDIARELARINLPLGTYTEKVWWINLHNLLHMLGLRMDSHAQWEIRQYANVIGNEIVKGLFPLVWEAFTDYRLNAMQLSGLEISVASELSQWGKQAERQVNFEFFCDEIGMTNKREQQECREKLVRLGILTAE